MGSQSRKMSMAGYSPFSPHIFSQPILSFFSGHKTGNTGKGTSREANSRRGYTEVCFPPTLPTPRPLPKYTCSAVFPNPPVRRLAEDECSRFFFPLSCFLPKPFRQIGQFPPLPLIQNRVLSSLPTRKKSTVVSTSSFSLGVFRK